MKAKLKLLKDNGKYILCEDVRQEKILLPEEPAIYLFYNQIYELMYVGQTNNLRVRTDEHLFYTANTKEVAYTFHYLKYIILHEKIDREIYELYYINYLKPKVNRSKVYTYKSEFDSLKINLQTITIPKKPSTIAKELQKEKERQLKKKKEKEWNDFVLERYIKVEDYEWFIPNDADFRIMFSSKEKLTGYITTEIDRYRNDVYNLVIRYDTDKGKIDLDINQSIETITSCDTSLYITGRNIEGRLWDQTTFRYGKEIIIYSTTRGDEMYGKDLKQKKYIEEELAHYNMKYTINYI